MAAKKWSELSPAYRKRLEAKGVTAELHRRKGNWNHLSTKTRRQYEKAGITKNLYEGGADLRFARGQDKQVFRVIDYDEIRKPVKYKTIKWFDSRAKWLETRNEGIDYAKWPPNVPPWWVIFS